MVAFVGRIWRMNAVRDAEGRVLGERRVPASARAGIPMETRACPYAGSRQGLPMNVSALRQMRSHWPEVLELCGAIASASGAGGWRGLLEACVAGAALPAYSIQRKDAPIADGALPPVFAATYKALAGALPLVRAALDSTPEPTARGLVDFAESSGRLVADGEACAGPPQMLAEAFSVLLSESHQRRAGTTGNGAGNALGELPRLLDLARLATDQILLADVLAAHDRLAEHALLESYCSAARSARPDPRVHALASSHLEALRSGAPLSGLAERAARRLALVNDPPRLFEAGVPTDLDAFLDRNATSGGGIGAPICRPIAAYARLRIAHYGAVASRERRIHALLGTDTPPFDSDRDLFPRVQTHAWIELLAGVRLELEPPRLAGRGSTFALDA